MPTVCVDFDGVIHNYSKGWQDGSIYDEPVTGAIEALKDLMTQYAVVIFTTRRDTIAVGQWLQKHGLDVPFEYGGEAYEFWNRRNAILITNRKLPAVAYIDDRAIRFVAWPQALHELEDYTA